MLQIEASIIHNLLICLWKVLSDSKLITFSKYNFLRHQQIKMQSKFLSADAFSQKTNFKKNSMEEGPWIKKCLIAILIKNCAKGAKI